MEYQNIHQALMCSPFLFSFSVTEARLICLAGLEPSKSNLVLGVAFYSTTIHEMTKSFYKTLTQKKKKRQRVFTKLIEKNW